MGRKERSLDPTTPAAQLAQPLRELRLRAGLTYRELGRRAHFHHTVMWRAAGGRVVAEWNVVEAFVMQCTPSSERPPDLAFWHTLWTAARQTCGGETE